MLVLADRVRENVFERRYTLTEVPYLGAGRGRDREDVTGATIARHEHPHDVVVGRMAFAAGGGQLREERLETAWRRLHAQLEDAAAWLLERGNRAGCGHR